MKTIQDTAQLYLFQTEANKKRLVKPFNTSLLKWVGSKQRVAHEIISYFPVEFGTYFEPFLGSGGFLGTLLSKFSIASDSFAPLMEIWPALKLFSQKIKAWYWVRWEKKVKSDKVQRYQNV